MSEVTGPDLLTECLMIASAVEAGMVRPLTVKCGVLISGDIRGCLL